MGQWSKADVNRLRELMRTQSRSVDETAEEIRLLCGCSKLAAYRMTHGLSQPDVVARYTQAAGGTFMDQPLLSRLEQFPARGSRQPLAAQLIVLASVYSTSPPRLLGADALDKLDPRERDVLVRCSASFLPAQDETARAPDVGRVMFNSGNPDIERQVAMAARRALRFAAMAEGTNVGPETLEQLRTEIARIATIYPQQALPTLLGDLMDLQDVAFRLLEGRQRPAQMRDLYLLASVTSGLLAKASHDLGDPHSAMTQARTAYVCADNADHHGMRVWVRGLQSLIAYWAGWPHEALRYTQLATDYAQRTTGTAAVWLPAQEARAWAVLGNTDATTAAIGRAEQARERVTPDELDAFGGLLTFTRPRQLYYTADATVWLPDAAERAERDATEAVNAYETAELDERSFGDEAGARTDLALARIARGELEGAREAVQPVFDLPPDQRINGVITSALRVHAALRNPEVSGSSVARAVQEEIEAFCQTPTAALPH